jgi:hypothetical protein
MCLIEYSTSIIMTLLHYVPKVVHQYIYDQLIYFCLIIHKRLTMAFLKEPCQLVIYFISIISVVFSMAQTLLRSVLFQVA